MNAARRNTAMVVRAAIGLGVALSLTACSEEELADLDVEIRSVTGALTSDPANERVEGTLSLGFRAGPEGDEIEISGLDLELRSEGVALENQRLEVETTFPIHLKAGTSGRAELRFFADSPLPPPPDPSGWCGPPIHVELRGTLGRGSDYGGPGDLMMAGAIPTLELSRTAAMTSDVSALWVGRLPEATDRRVRRLAVDAEGNALVGMDVYADFAVELLPPVISKFDATGRLLWTRDLGGQGVIFAGVDVAAGADVEVAAGLFFGSLNLGDGLMNSEGAHSAFVTRLDAAGATVWTRQIASLFNDDNLENWSGLWLHGVVVDGSGNVLVAATSDGAPVAIGDDAVIEPEPGAAPYWPFSFLVEFSPSGDYLSGRRLGGLVQAITVDPSGARVLAGTFQGTVDLGGDPLTVADQGIWVAKLDAEGQHVFSRAFEASGDLITVSTLALGPAGEVHLAAQAGGTIDFGQGPLQSSERGHFVAKLDAQGAPQWSKRYAETREETAPGLAVDDAGQVFLLGAAYHSIDFGAGLLPSSEGSVLYAAELAPTGAQLSAGIIGCGGSWWSPLVFRSGASVGVTFATTFRRAAALGNHSFTTGGFSEVLIGALGH